MRNMRRYDIVKITLRNLLYAGVAMIFSSVLLGARLTMHEEWMKKLRQEMELRKLIRKEVEKA